MNMTLNTLDIILKTFKNLKDQFQARSKVLLPSSTLFQKRKQTLFSDKKLFSHVRFLMIHLCRCSNVQ